MKHNLSTAELHALYVEKALMGTPDHLRDECAVALSAEASRQASVMGMYVEDLTPAITGLLSRIRYQEQVAQAQADLNAATAELVAMPALRNAAAIGAVNRVLNAVCTLNNTVQAAADHASEARACYQCKYQCKAAAETDC